MAGAPSAVTGAGRLRLLAHEASAAVEILVSRSFSAATWGPQPTGAAMLRRGSGVPLPCCSRAGARRRCRRGVGPGYAGVLQLAGKGLGALRVAVGCGIFSMN